MSARKSFPRLKNVDNSKPKLTCSNEPNGPTTDSSNDGGASVTKKKKSGPKSIRRINVQSSKNQNLPSSTGQKGCLSFDPGAPWFAAS